MLFGAHVSIAGGIDNAPKRAASLGCEVFQIFSRSPQGGPAPKLTKKIVKNFKQEIKLYNLKKHYIHTPYYVNFASTNNRVRHGTVNVIKQELERGSLLGTEYIMTHLGSARDIGREKAISRTVDGLVKILKDYSGSAKLLLEIAAGAGETLGGTFEELGEIIEHAEKKLKRKNILNICFDTQHAFASGYDLRTPKAIKATLKQFDKALGLKRLKLSHCNDSKVNFGQNVDRHANIGQGKMGRLAFKSIIEEPKFKKVNLILETPRDKKGTEIKKELKLLKSYRAQ